MMISGSMKSFHRPMNCMIASVPMTLPDIGSTTFQICCRWPGPPLSLYRAGGRTPA